MVLGVGKLLTCGGCGIWSIVDWFLIMDATRQSNAQNFIHLLANENLFHTLVGLPPAFFRLYLLVFVVSLRNLPSTPSNTTQFNPKTVWP